MIKTYREEILDMKKRDYMSFWCFMSILLAITTAIMLFLLLYATIFEYDTISDLINSSYTVDLLIAIVVVSMFTIPLFILCFRRARKEATMSTALYYAPELREMVKVITKTTQALDSLTTIAVFVIAFEFPGSVRKAIEMDAQQYSLIAEGEIGMLTYKRHKDILHFVSFKPLH